LPKGLKLKSGDIFDPDESAPLFNGDNRLLSKHCPMCSGRAVSDEQVVARLLKKLGTTRVKVERQVVAERKVAKKTGTRKKTAGMKQPRKAAVKKPKAATQRSRNRWKRGWRLAPAAMNSPSATASSTADSPSTPTAFCWSHGFDRLAEADVVRDEEIDPWEKKSWSKPLKLVGVEPDASPEGI
jgi:hypothetical protein